MNCPRCSMPFAAGQAVCVNCGLSLTAESLAPQWQPGSQWQPVATPALISVAGLSTATVIVFSVVGLCYLGSAFTQITGVSSYVIDAGLLALTVLSLLVLVPLFLVWFFQIRRNAGLWGAQRRSQGWSIGGWFVPIVFLWFPFQIAQDAWRASQPHDAGRQRSSVVLVGWWLCWVLAWFTGFYNVHTTGTRSDGSTFETSKFGVTFGGNLASTLFAAAAAFLGAVMVWSLGRMQEARLSPYPP